MDEKDISSLPPTEQVDQKGCLFDQAPIAEQLNAIVTDQFDAISAVRSSLAPLTAAVSEALQRLRGTQGRLVYAGAGCSIRIGVQDGVELVPTFGWPLVRLCYLIAGGLSALSQSIEGAEDDVDAAALQVSDFDIGIEDVVIGIAASGNTPFTCQALQSARDRGALTIAVTCNPKAQLVAEAHHAIVTETGTEVLAGSTRLGAGTAQKAILNAFSTVLMTNLGRVLGNEMLCVKATNKKLKLRQIRILATQIDHMSKQQAYELLTSVDWDLRVGLLVAKGLSEADARDAIESEVSFRQLFKCR